MCRKSGSLAFIVNVSAFYLKYWSNYIFEKKKTKVFVCNITLKNKKNSIDKNVKKMNFLIQLFLPSCVVFV